ncbi:MAG: DUF2130 domain-containing protein [Pseudorhodoplanes sp.]|jgi:hypothetical protein|nr:DUF2130 domain-containing protein [Pseudorhodoplanes sp.]
MQEPIIACPNCHTEIKLTESLAAPLIEATRRQYEHKIAEKEADVSKREAQVRAQLGELEKAKAAIEEQVAAKLKAERERIAADEAKKARLAIGAELNQKAQELQDLHNILQDRDVKLAEAQKAQAELLRKQRELDDARRELDLTVEKKVQESLVIVRERAKLEAEEALKLKVTEKEEQIASMQRQIEELKRKAEQGSQQAQGEAQEIELENLLRSKFPTDAILPVPKGEFGGDALQKVMSPLGQHCGTILWEFKRTKNWSDSWLSKLREDQRSARAEIAIIVSTALPKGVHTFDHADGVWVTDARCAIPLAIALRHSLMEIASARNSVEGQHSKMELVYQYLTGPRFKHRIEAIVEKFGDMQEDLEKERKAMTRLWARREEQIRVAVESMAGMYGDLQGIAGRTMQEISGLELPMIEENS